MEVKVEEQLARKRGDLRAARELWRQAKSEAERDYILAEGLKLRAEVDQLEEIREQRK